MKLKGEDNNEVESMYLKLEEYCEGNSGLKTLEYLERVMKYLGVKCVEQERVLVQL
jgi:hypothetical protein